MTTAEHIDAALDHLRAIGILDAELERVVALAAPQPSPHHAT